MVVICHFNPFNKLDITDLYQLPGNYTAVNENLSSQALGVPLRSFVSGETPSTESLEVDEPLELLKEAEPHLQLVLASEP